MARGKKLGDAEGQLVGINMFIFIIFTQPEAPSILNSKR